MKHFPMLGSLAVVLGGLLTTHAGWASGDALNLPGNLARSFCCIARKAIWEWI